MNYRLTTVLAREDHDADTTKVIEINLRDPISRMQVIFEPDHGADAEPAGHPALCISKIEIVDGSDVIYSLSGIQTMACDWYQTLQEPPNIISNFDAILSELIYNINFGRFLYDPLYAFDPTKFTNPQLKITIDIDAGGSNTASGYLTVLADIFDDKTISPEGFLMHKEIKDYAFGSATHEYTDLPTDYPYRKLFVASLVAGTGPDYIFDNIKLSEDHDKKIPLNHSISQILKAVVGRNGPYREKQWGPGNLNSIYYRCTPTYKPVGVVTFWVTPCPAGMISFYSGSGGRFALDMNTATSNWQAIIEGHCPHGVLEIPFGLQDDPKDWYDVTKLGSLRLDIFSASGMSSSESCQIFLQQLRNYA
ncbi:hypothetical protein ES702_04550 [subsurface metagenome]